MDVYVWFIKDICSDSIVLFIVYFNKVYLSFLNNYYLFN